MRRACLALLSSLLLSACGSRQAGTCDRDADCPVGQGCLAGRCQIRCVDSTDCPAGTHCARSVCVPCGVDGCLPGRDGAGGDPLPGDPAGDGGSDPSGGDPTSGDPSSGDPGGADPNGADPNGGDPNGADPNGGDPNGGDGCGPGTEPCNGGCIPLGGCCPVEASETACVNGVDEDCNGLFDCADPACGNVVCRPAVDACDAAELCPAGGGVCPGNGFAGPGTLCGSSAADDCDAPDTCDGAGTCVDRVDAASVPCRGSASACDRVEYCTGSTKTCPADAVAPVESGALGAATYGFLWGVGESAGSAGAQYVEAACDNDTLARAFIDFDTSVVPSSTVILTATLRLCLHSANGPDNAQLYDATFGTGLSLDDWNAPVTFLREVPFQWGSVTFDVPPASVNPGSLTQYSLRYPVTSCPGAYPRRRYASPGNEYLPDCPADSGPLLTATYCTP